MGSCVEHVSFNKRTAAYKKKTEFAATKYKIVYVKMDRIWHTVSKTLKFIAEKAKNFQQIISCSRKMFWK